MPLVYAGERLETIASFPTLYRYLPVTTTTRHDEKPLVIFIPGMALLGRVAYGGHSGYDARDFLAYWLNEMGYNVLAISYPLELERDDADDSDDHLQEKLAQCPHFTPRDWGEQAVQTARRVTEENGLARDIVVAAWSMAGKILKPLVFSARQHGLNLRLFVSLAATPAGVKWLNFTPPRVRETEAGFAAGSQAGIQHFMQQFQAQNIRQEGEGVIDDKKLRCEYIGNTPVGLTNAGLVYDGESPHGERFKAATSVDLGTIEPNGYDDMVHFPYIAAIRPTSPSDLRHALTDGAAWGLLLTTKMAIDVTRVVGGTRKWQGDEDEVWHEIQRLVSSAPGRLTSDIIRGNHMFFIGQTGARATAEAMDRLIREADTIGLEMEAALGRLQSAV